MAASWVKNHTTAGNKTAGTTLAVPLDTTVPAGNLIVAAIIFDNAATASKPIVSTTTPITKMAGETNSWVFLGAARSTSTSAGAFASGELWCILTTVAWAAASYTLTLDTSVTQKATRFVEFTGSLGTARSTAGSAYSTTTTAASATTTGTTPQVGDLVLGLLFYSNSVTTPATDADTVGGSWSSSLDFGTTGGSGATNNTGGFTYKVLTAASHQTFNTPGTPTAGNGAIVAILEQYVPPAITQASYRLYADGTETASTALAAQDTAYGATVDSDLNLQVRLRLQSTNAIAPAATDDWQLQWEKNASGTWTDVVSLIGGYSGGSRTSQNIGSTLTERSQSFMGNGSNLGGARFFMSRSVAAQDGNIDAVLYAHTGTFGSSGVPTGSPLAVSTTVIPASDPSFTTTNEWRYFAFDGTFTLTNGTPYFIGLRTTNTLSGFMSMGRTTAGTHAGNSAMLNPTWTAESAGVDLWFEVHAGGTTVSPFDSPNLVDGAATTNRLGAGTGSFVAGKVSEDGLVDDLGWTANNYTELLYSVTLKADDLTNGDVLRFRVLRNGVATTLTYTQVPTINVVKTAAVGGKPKYYNGSTWVEKPLKVWNGSAWVEKPLKVYSGSAWVLA